MFVNMKGPIQPEKAGVFLMKKRGSITETLTKWQIVAQKWNEY